MMDSAVLRSLLVVASLQAAVALTAIASSSAAAVAAGAVGVLVLARYGAVAFLAATLGPGAKAGLRVFALSAWFLGLLALGAVLAAVAVKARLALPWAIAAALAGPLTMSAIALGTGIGNLASARAGHPGGTHEHA
jgi:hypothetical protein